ncbi:unnamed protein product, partial [Notodromas monacha]
MSKDPGSNKVSETPPGYDSPLAAARGVTQCAKTRSHPQSPGQRAADDRVVLSVSASSGLSRALASARIEHFRQYPFTDVRKLRGHAYILEQRSLQKKIPPSHDAECCDNNLGMISPDSSEVIDLRADGSSPPISNQLSISPVSTLHSPDPADYNLLPPDLFSGLMDLADIYAPDERVDVIVLNFGPVPNSFWGYLVPSCDAEKKGAFEDVLTSLPQMNGTWRLAKSLKFADRVMCRQGPNERVFRGTVISKKSESVVVFSEDYGCTLELSSAATVTEIDPSYSFPALILAFMEVPDVWLSTFRDEASASKKRGGKNPPDFSPEATVKGSITASGDGIFVDLGPRKGETRFRAMRWDECVEVSLKFNELGRRRRLLPGDVISAAVSCYTFPNPFVFCYAIGEVGMCADLTDALVGAAKLFEQN